MSQLGIAFTFHLKGMYKHFPRAKEPRFIRANTKVVYSWVKLKQSQQR